MSRILNPTRNNIVVRHIKDLGSGYDLEIVMEMRRSGDNVVCAFNGTRYSGFVGVPSHAFDTVATRKYAVVGELKEYIRQHPQPTPQP